MNKRGLLLVISGPSGAGKGTICKALVEKHKELYVSVSATTRQPRVGEIDGVNYHFTTKEQFIERIEQNDFLEYAEVYGNYYGTPKSKVEEMLSKGIDVILEIDIQGALKVKENFEEGVFINPVIPPACAPQDTLVRFALMSTHTKEQVERGVKALVKVFNEFGLLKK